MGQVLKAQFQVYILGLLILLPDEKISFFQSLAGQPVAGRVVIDLLKITLKSGQATAGQKGEAFKKNIKPEVPAHKGFDIYLLRSAEIEKHAGQARVTFEQDQQQFFPLKVCKSFFDLRFPFVIGLE